jgi:endoglucanase Acf2
VNLGRIVFGLLFLSLGASLGAQTPQLAQSPLPNMPSTWQHGGFRAPPAPEFATANFKAPYPSNTWWGSLLWERFSGVLVAQPFLLQASKNGMALDYPKLLASSDGFFTPFAANITVGLQNSEFLEARVHRASDFVVQARMQAKQGGLDITFGHGLPFVWFSSQKTIQIGFSSAPDIWARPCQQIPCNALGMRVAGRDYVFFTAANVQWRGSGRTRSVSGGVLSIAALPEEAQENAALRLPAIALLAQAQAMPVDSLVTWRWSNPDVLVTHRLETVQAAPTLMGLYPHQWQNTSTPLLPWSYTSARGAIRLIAKNHFETQTRYTGILPNLPLTQNPDSLQVVRQALLTFVDNGKFFPLAPESFRVTDAYTDARNFGRLVQALEIAEQLGETKAAQTLVAAIRERLEEWFDPAPPHALLFDARWGVLIPAPASHGADYQLNDHHFIFGYFLQAAASVVQRDPKWLERHKPVLDVLAREIAADAMDKSFPKNRNFDPYLGHSWASGDSRGRSNGANQESSSEAVNAWAGLIRYAQISQNPALLGKAIGLYALETQAVWTYWFRAGGQFPPNYPHTTLGILWGNGGEYNTWWTNAKGAIHLIQALPLTGASLYLARDKNFVLQNHLAFSKERYWNDLAAMYLALADPAQGYATWNQELRPEFGNSLPQTQHWFASLAEYGTPNQTISADVPQYAVFEKTGRRTYVFFNPSQMPQSATFSDGMVLTAVGQGYVYRSIEVKQ